MYQEIEGNLFEHLPKHTEQGQVILPHVVNNQGKWESGFAAALDKVFPVAKADYIDWHSGGEKNLLPFGLGRVKYCCPSQNLFVANMCAQILSGQRPHVRDLRYDKLADCMSHVSNWSWMDWTGKPQIVCPRFGSGLAGGNWEFIKELIQDCWIKAGIPVTVYYLNKATGENEAKNVS